MNKKLLLIDDDIDTLASLELNLSRSFEVQTARGAQEAMEKINSSPPYSVIISDFSMPLINGIEFFSQVKNITPETLRILLTGHADLDIAINAINAGNIFKFLIKPVKKEFLIKQIEEAVEFYHLRTSQQELVKMKNQFISIVSHEYKNPLSVILSSSYILSDYFKMQDEENFEKFINKIQQSVFSMTTLLNSILIIAKNEEGLPPRLTRINLSLLIENSINESREFYKHSHDIVFNYPNNPLFLNSESTTLKLIIDNLLSNAIKYSESGTKVFVFLKENEESIELAVEDKGIGIPEEEIPNLFKPFYRCENTLHIKGTGLGLSIVDKCVNILKGKISLSSKINKGTKVLIEFPRI